MLAEETKQRSIADREKGKNTFQKSWKMREKFLTSGNNGTRVICTKRGDGRSLDSLHFF